MNGDRDNTAPLDFDQLVAYWLGELSEAQAEAIEERVFADERAAHQLEVVARLAKAVSSLVRGGQVQHALTARDVARLERQGVVIRQYSVARGETINCGIDREDFVALHLQGVVQPASAGARIERVDVEAQVFPEGGEPMSERHDDVPLDRGNDEVVLLYPGDGIRALPATRVHYRVFGESAEGRRLLGEYHLNHSP